MSRLRAHLMETCWEAEKFSGK